jgi:hypothetical protein
LPWVRTSLEGTSAKKSPNGYLRREAQIGTTNKFHLDGLFRALEAMKEYDELRELNGLGKDQAPRYKRVEERRRENAGAVE